LGFSTGVTGQVDSNPTNDTTGDMVDAGASFADDEHNGRTLMITSGNAIGNLYTIDDTVAADDAVYCTGDNLYSDGVRADDYYEIFYDLLVNTDGHNHDNVNSPSVVFADGWSQMIVRTITDTEFTRSDAGWETIQEVNIYIPSNTDTITVAARQKTGNVSYTAQLQFLLHEPDEDGGSLLDTSGSDSCATLGYTINEASLDVTARSGWYTLKIQHAIQGGSSTVTTKGINIVIKA
jgi:hypothetical protein